MTLAIVFGLYLTLMAGIGIYCARFNKDLGDFVLGGRKLGPWVAAFSAQASDFSGWLLVGLPAAAYAGGFSLIWTCVGCSLGVMFNWMVLAPAMRYYAVKYDALTVPDFLESRFNDTTRIIRVMAVLTILVFYASYISQQFDAAGKVFSSAFAGNVPWGETETWTYYRQGMLIGMVVILGYTAMGGFLAVCWTDFVQAILMVSALVALPIVSIVKLGGPEGMWHALKIAADGDLLLAIDNGKTGASFLFGVVLAGLAWGVGYPGQPHIVSRYMAIENPKKIAKSSLIAIVWSLFALYGSMFIGLSARAILGSDLTGPDVDKAMPLLTLQLLPPVFAGLVLSAAVAAMMSTVDSQIIIAVAAVVRDIYEKLLGRHPSDKGGVLLSRIVLVGLGVGGIVMAWEKGNVFQGVLDAWGGLAAGLGPAIILGCVWKGTSRAGVIVGMITGFLMTQFWAQLMSLVKSAGLPDAVPHLQSTQLLVCVGANLILVILISLAAPPKVRPD
jgi:sodium/proline symporter